MKTAGEGSRNKVQFERRVAGADDGYGNTLAATWTPLSSFHATFRPQFGREQLAAGRLESTLKGTLTVRRTTNSSTITAADRAVFLSGPYAGRSGQIRSIIPTPDNREFEMLVECGVAE